MADNVKHNITYKLYKFKKTTGEKGVFIQVISRVREAKCILFFSIKLDSA